MTPTVESARTSYVDAILDTCRSNMTDEQQAAIVAEVEQFLVDMMDVCEQTLVAEPAITAAHDALRAPTEGRALAQLIKGNEERLLAAERSVVSDAKALVARVEDQHRIIDDLQRANALLREQLRETREQNAELRAAAGKGAES